MYLTEALQGIRLPPMTGQVIDALVALGLSALR
jgi:hypothetical protein